jgi:hypothetical protein
MENSKKILFGGDAPAEWFVVHGDRWLGPMTVSEVAEKVGRQEISWAHFAWKEGEAGWRRLCDIADFQVAVPEKPDPKLAKPAAKDARPDGADSRTRHLKQPPSPPAEVARNWFLYYNDSQFGPFSSGEIGRFLRIGKIHGRVYAWRDGLGNWTRLQEIADFKADIADAEKGKPSAPPLPVDQTKTEKRAGPRRPLVARLILANEATVVVAVCRDVSLGGMQVLTDRIPGRVGQKLRMNITPGGGNPSDLDPFVAEGVIVRILEDGRGFSFRFERLADEARKAVEQYIAQGG